MSPDELIHLVKKANNGKETIEEVSLLEACHRLGTTEEEVSKQVLSGSPDNVSIAVLRMSEPNSTIKSWEIWFKHYNDCPRIEHDPKTGEALFYGAGEEIPSHSCSIEIK